MPRTRIVFYRDSDASVPVLDWLRELKRRKQRAYAKCIARFNLLAEYGHELRRPHADYVTDGIYELRARDGKVNYRMLYFFHGRNVAILTSSFTKVAKVPKAEIQRAIQRRNQFQKSPTRHSYSETDFNG